MTNAKPRLGASRLLLGALLSACASGSAGAALADDQTVPGLGNPLAARIAGASPLVQSALLREKIALTTINDPYLRSQTKDALLNPQTCIRHRANLTESDRQGILTQLIGEGLVNPADASTISGGVEAGIFPPVLDDGSGCPHLPQPFLAAPGSNFHGHGSFPGGLPVHEAYNLSSALSFAQNYRLAYGQPGFDGLPRMALLGPLDTLPKGDLQISNDFSVAAPLWHDWAKPIVFQWNADGSEFTELNFGGAGATDNNGRTGDSRTGAHHILSLAESMARRLPPLFIVTQAAAHSAPTLGNEFKVVNWLRAAAIIARVDPLAAGYLVKDASGAFHLPPPPATAGSGVDLAAAGQTNILLEYEVHNLSDADFTFSIPAITESEVVLAALAPSYGYEPSDTANYNNRFRNPVLANLSGERILILYTTRGIDAVRGALDLLHRRGTI